MSCSFLERGYQGSVIQTKSHSQNSPNSVYIKGFLRKELRPGVDRGVGSNCRPCAYKVVFDATVSHETEVPTFACVSLWCRSHFSAFAGRGNSWEVRARSLVPNACF